MPSIERQDQFIRSLGVEAYRVGGSVRDEIIGRKPKDADYIVRGIGFGPLFKLLNKAGAGPRPLTDRQGQQFGWRCQGWAGIEISLPRTEWNDGSGRRMGIRADPNLSLAEDAKRRDFTFNALYRRLEGMLSSAADDIIDPTGTGIHDLQHRIIRTTHPDSFRDDPLRMLRALRFVSTLDADLAGETAEQMMEWAPRVGELTHKGFTSGTVFDEFSKMLMGQEPGKALRTAARLSEFGVLAAALPELADMVGFEGGPHHDLTVDEHTFKAIQTAANVGAPLRVLWALLFHDAGKPEAAWCDKDGRLHFYEPSEEVWAKVAVPSIDGPPPKDHQEISERLWREAAKRMNVPRKFIEEAATIIREHMVADKHRVPQVWVCRMRVKLGDDLLRDLLLHRMCDHVGKEHVRPLHGMLHMAELENLRKAAQEDEVPTSVKDLAINGNDVKHLAAPERGEALRRVLDEVVCDPSPLKRSREWQLGRL